MKKNILFVILFLAVLGIVLYFVFGSKQYDNWMDYIMDSEIKLIELAYCDENDLVDDVPMSKTISINKNELNKIFGEIEKGKLTKHYGGGFGSGCPYGLTINYIRNNNEYKLNLDYYNLISNDMEDKDLLKIIENSEYEISKTPIDGYEYTENDVTYILNYNVDIIDEYIK